MEDYNTIIVIPLPHLNIISFGGMKNKHDYLIWRESKGFFTALDCLGNLCTWSILSGKLLYTLKHDLTEDASEYNIGQYVVYRSNDDDITYTRDAYRFNDYSLCLLRGIEPLRENYDKEVKHTCSMNFVRCDEIFGEI